MRGINEWAVATVRNSGGIVKWSEKELENLDRKTRKLLKIHKALHLRSNVARIYLPRKEGGSISVEECVRTKKQPLRLCKATER